MPVSGLWTILFNKGTTMEKMINGYPHILLAYSKPQIETLKQRSEDLLKTLLKRRSVREFSQESFPIEALENIIKMAGSAPSGANKQPWTFCIIQDPELKKQIRQAAEKEEKLSYEQRMTESWLKDLEPLGTNWEKPFLEKAPYLVIVFKRIYEYGGQGEKLNNYYVNESVGLACGFFISALHQLGLVTLTHTPSPMNFLQDILQRPDNERPFLLLPVGFPSEPCFVPKINKKGLEQICSVY